jgi:hypothetical protein
MNVQQTHCPETSEHKIQTPGNHPKNYNTQNTAKVFKSFIKLLNTTKPSQISYAIFFSIITIRNFVTKFRYLKHSTVINFEMFVPEF